jgi:sugar diacid utilization regulator/putative methionine-R-sulfoxide reductase with GAF domain
MAARASAVNSLSIPRPQPQEVHLLHEAIALLTRAADRGQDALFSEARILFRNALNAFDTRIVVRSAGIWREWNRLDSDDCLEPEIASIADGLGPNDGPSRFRSVVVAPVSGSAVAVVADIGDAPEIPTKLLRSLCQVLHLALGACDSRHGNPDKLEAIRVFQRVANRILNSGDLDAIFTNITHEAKGRLSADICGIMLKEDEWLVMQRCVGNLASETASLRMRSGQGVAGRVFATREACAIEDYLRSSVISRDFFNLARAERVKSALAVPLLSQSEVIGVLEVWRRRPSQFTPQHTVELATLANLASLAIEHVRLASARESAARRLEIAHTELQARYDVVRTSAALQEELTALLLAGRTLPEIAELASRRLARPVMILDRRLEVETCCPANFEFQSHLQEIKAQVKSGAESRALFCATKHLRFYCQTVVAGAEHLGWAAVFGPEAPSGVVQLALGEICATIALHRMRERAAARALSDKVGSLLWDMIEAPEPTRRIASERVRDLGVDLSGDMCVIVFAFETRAHRAGGPSFEARDLAAGGWRQAIAELPARLPLSNRTVKLCTLRGDELIVIAAIRDGAKPREVAAGVRRDLDRILVDAVSSAGVSRLISSTDAMPLACKDARVALAVTKQAGGDRVLTVEDIGVAGLLMSLRDGADFRGFIEEKMGRLLSQRSPRRETLLETLRAYFASNCSQDATARHLRLHQKTVAYRLNKIERITGFDLNTHESRMLLDLAVRMKDLVP